MSRRRSRISSRRAIVGLLVGFVLAATAAVIARSADSALPASISKATDRTWFAKVDEHGKLLASRHVISVSHPKTGEFRVVFNRSVVKCAPVAGVRGTAANQFYGFVTTYTPGGATVRVVLRNASGTPSDGAGFNLVSNC